MALPPFVTLPSPSIHAPRLAGIAGRRRLRRRLEQLVAKVAQQFPLAPKHLVERGDLFAGEARDLARLRQRLSLALRARWCQRAAYGPARPRHHDELAVGAGRSCGGILAPLCASAERRRDGVAGDARHRAAVRRTLATPLAMLWPPKTACRRVAQSRRRAWWRPRTAGFESCRFSSPPSETAARTWRRRLGRCAPRRCRRAGP